MHNLTTSEMILLLQLQLNNFGYSWICNYKIISLSSFFCAFVIKHEHITIPLLLTTSLNSNYTTVQTGAQLYAKLIHITKWELNSSFIRTCLSSGMGTGISIIIQLHLQDFSKSCYSSIFFQITKLLSQNIHISPNLHHPRLIINIEKL
jgi:hypothetical protein